jgi:hypothetical protein
MSVAVHDPVEYVDRDEAEQARHPRAVVWSAAAATLAVIAGPVIAAALGFVERVDPDDGGTLTSLAQRVLEETPGAYETAGMVVVPAAGDRGVSWTGVVLPDRVDGVFVDLGVNGLAQYGSDYYPSGSTSTEWLTEVTPGDQVFADVGALSFACMRWPGADSCTGALILERTGTKLLFRSGLSIGESADQIRTFRVLDAGLPTQLVLGAMPRGAVAAMVLTADDHEVRARSSDPGAVAGETLWWLSVTEPVRTITFFDEKYRVLERVNVVD